MNPFFVISRIYFVCGSAVHKSELQVITTNEDIAILSIICYDIIVGVI